MHLILIQLNRLFASHEGHEKLKPLSTPVIVQVNVSHQKPCILKSKGGAEILNFKNCMWVCLMLPRGCPVSTGCLDLGTKWDSSEKLLYIDFGLKIKGKNPPH